MKAIIYTGCLIATPFLLDACKAKKSTTVSTTTAATPTTTTVSTRTTITPPTNNNVLPPITMPVAYRLVVSFTSIGEGIDHSAQERFKKLISEHPQKIKYETIPWGREGEIDYCFNLMELEEKEQVDLVNKIKKLLTSAKFVEIQENKPSTHQQ